MTCIDKGCRRRALPRFNRCEYHVTALVARLGL